MIKWIWAKLTGGKLVWLRDFNGTCTKSIAYKNAFGELTAERWWPMAIRRVILNADGSIDGSYVTNWKYT